MFYLLIVSFSLCLSAAGLGVDIFGKDNARKSKRDNPGTKAQRETNREDDLITSTNTKRQTGVDNPDVGVNNLDTIVNNSSIATDNLDIVAKSSSIATNNLGIIVDNLGIIVDNLGIATDNLNIETDKDIKAENLSIKIDVDIKIDNLGIAASNKVYATSFFALRRTFFLLASFSKLVTVSFLFSLPFLSSNTLRSKSILLC